MLPTAPDALLAMIDADRAGVLGVLHLDREAAGAAVDQGEVARDRGRVGERRAAVGGQRAGAVGRVEPMHDVAGQAAVAAAARRTSAMPAV